MTDDRISDIDVFVFCNARDELYLGPLAEDECINERGYIVRKGNGTIYPTQDRSVVVRVTTESGVVGWGETYGICAPRATGEILVDLLAPVLKGQSVEDIEGIWQRLYNLMRVRGFFSGFYLDAIAAIDIALWDIKGKNRQQPVSRLLNANSVQRVPAYISGLPAESIEEKIDIASYWFERGFNQFKIAAAVSHDGVFEELAALRRVLGDEVELMVDLHWKYDEDEALALIREIAPLNIAFAEAPLKPEDVSGLARLAKVSPVPLAGGEEWYTEYQASERIKRKAVAIVQPEMGHTGITQFLKIAQLANEWGCRLAPNATIGAGIFMA
ncbi:MAG: mandelate racemase/muconate lactonizing enzyme family protein, partial [Pseudomonadota bacterium]